MSSLVLDVWSKGIEAPLYAVGLMQSPPRRFAAFTGATALGLWAFKPLSLFDRNGKPLVGYIYGNQDGPYLDWMMLSGFVGVMSVVFI
jgi:hypothetical protein